MGQGLSCAPSHEQKFFRAVQLGDLGTVVALLEKDPSLLTHTTVYDRYSALHLAAINGRIQILSLLLDRLVNPDILNRHKQTPLMLAVMHGKITCVEKLLEAGANILKFDTNNGRTCLHYGAYYGHLDCLQAILSAAHSSRISDSWGFTRFVNIRDGNGATPLHLAARQRRPDCVHILLDSGALVCASTGGYGLPGSTPLHLAARGGSLDCIRELLAWGADRQYRDAAGYIPYMVALKHKHGACAALLNPTSAEPIVWPSPLKFISELKPDAKALLERALMEANIGREKKILKGTTFSLASPTNSDELNDGSSEGSDSELCNICFDQVCTIEVQTCGHQMCANCTLTLCCHSKPNPTTAYLPTPLCPFCRSIIARLVVAKLKPSEDIDLIPSKQRKVKKSKTYSDGSSSFKSLAAGNSFGKMGGRGSGRVAADNDDFIEDKS
ncbi:E3 ubiquitin-protein ligase xb3 [Thalictrum thalictroides]|uniref:RING-type E3 ubiquitin transferase n=1 Tax=Thalictrum thalictroides TaxID=46969 RepID=A0A7J6VKD4_THATH|nr:E3 ubiquitin-protein ligase xb3 [Thalictrum thalictroides]